MLKINQLIGFGAGGEALVFAYVTHLEDTSGLATVTFTAADLGAAAGDRDIIIAVGASKAATTWSADPITSVTIGGVTAVIAGSQVLTQTLTGGVAAIYRARVPTGATGDVVIALAATTAEVAIVIWRATGLNNVTPTATTNDNTSPLTQSLTIDTGGFAVGFLINNGSTQAASWTNLTERSDVAHGPGSYSGADTSTAGSPSITATPAAGTLVAMVLAAWR